MTAEAERIAQGNVDLSFAGLERDKIHLKAAALIDVVEIYGGGDS